MKNKFFLILFCIFLSTKALAQNLSIEAKKITLDKEKRVSIFENEVKIKTDKVSIKSDYLEYDKNIGFLRLRMVG